MDMIVYTYICVYTNIHMAAITIDFSKETKFEKSYDFEVEQGVIWEGLGRTKGTENYCNLNTISNIKRILFSTFLCINVYSFNCIHALPNTVISENFFLQCRLHFIFFWGGDNFNALGIILIALQIKL